MNNFILALIIIISSLNLVKDLRASNRENNSSKNLSALLSLEESYKLSEEIFNFGITDSPKFTQIKSLLEQNKNISKRAMAYLAVFNLYGYNIELDKQECFLKINEALEEDPNNIFMLNAQGYCYNNGVGVKKNHKKAFELYTRATEGGHLTATNNLAMCYKNGFGVEKNPTKAFELYTIASKGGILAATNNLAWCYENGFGVEKDPTKAFELLTIASKGGTLAATNNLALCYENGFGVEKNPQKAVELYTIASKGGILAATFHLALCYRDGFGCEINLDKASNLYREYLIKNYNLKIDEEMTFPLQKESLPVNMGCFSLASIQVIFDHASNQGMIDPKASTNDWEENLFNLLQSPQDKFVQVIQPILEKVIHELEFVTGAKLCNEIIMAGIRLMNKDDTDSAYHVYNDLLKKRQEKLSFDNLKLGTEYLNGYHLTLNPKYFEKTLQKDVVRVSDLPRRDYKQLFDASIKTFKKLHEGSETTQNFNTLVTEETGSTWDLIETGTLGSNYFQDLLKFGIEKASILKSSQIHFCSILSFVYSKEKENRDNSLLSASDLQLLKILTGIAECQRGKDEMVENIYQKVIPSKFKIHSPSSGCVELINRYLIDEVEKLITGGDTPCMKKLCGLKIKETVEQSPHQAQYVRNLIPYLGNIIFDIHTKTLYIPLLHKSRPEVMQEIYQRLRPAVLISNITHQLNEKLKEEKSGIYMIINTYMDTNDIWDTQNKQTTIKEEGTLLLLHKMGVIKATPFMKNNDEEFKN